MYFYLPYIICFVDHSLSSRPGLCFFSVLNFPLSFMALKVLASNSNIFKEVGTLFLVEAVVYPHRTWHVYILLTSPLFPPHHIFFAALPSFYMKPL